jgi:hypothetical protein
MPRPNRDNLVHQIHRSGRELVLSITGGGSGAIAALLEVPGASAVVLEAVVPYSPAALAAWLGGTFDQACSEATARAMAMASFERARALSQYLPLPLGEGRGEGKLPKNKAPSPSPLPEGEGSEMAYSPRMLRGIGATASLATTRPKRGPHRIHVAWQSTDRTVVVSTELEKGARSRAAEEEDSRNLVLDIVAEACGVDTEPLSAPELRSRLVRREKQAPVAWSDLLLGRRAAVAVGDGAASRPAVVFPGAFHPLHAGHDRMAQVAAARCGAPTTFELSIANVDKPPLDFIEIDDRLTGLAGRPVLLTRAATFADKAQLVPGVTFVVGADTIIRIGDPQYYGGDPARRDAAIATIAGQGCRFLVFGRLAGGAFCRLADLDLPASLLAMCDEVPEAEFRADTSSTELRSR